MRITQAAGVPLSHSCLLELKDHLSEQMVKDLDEFIRLKGNRDSLLIRYDTLLRIQQTYEEKLQEPALKTLKNTIQKELELVRLMFDLLSGKRPAHEIYKQLSTTSICPLIAIKNFVLYSQELKTLTGFHELEFMDPFHRKFGPLKVHFPDLDTRKEDSMHPQLFLELLLLVETTQVALELTLYLDQDALQNYQIRCQKGQLLTHTDQVYSTQEQFELFIIDHTGGIYAGAMASRQFHHSSLSLGLPVVASGRWRVQRGKIIAIDFNSGHYLPTFEEGIVGVELLKSQGVICDESLTISFFEDGAHKTKIFR